MTAKKETSQSQRCVAVFGTISRCCLVAIVSRAVVEIMGLEPMTSCMPCKRSSQLSYTPNGKFTGAKVAIYFQLRKYFPYFFASRPNLSVFSAVNGGKRQLIPHPMGAISPALTTAITSMTTCPNLHISCPWLNPNRSFAHDLLNSRHTGKQKATQRICCVAQITLPRGRIF